MAEAAGRRAGLRLRGGPFGAVAGWVTLALALASAPLTARQIAGPPGQPVDLDFQDLDLAFVLSALAQAADLNILYYDLPNVPVTLRANDVPREELPAIINWLAANNGIAVSQQGSLLSLVGVGELPDPDPRQFFIYRLRHARATTLAATLQALFGGGGGVPLTGRGAGFGTLSQQLQQIQAGGGAAGFQAPQQQAPQIVFAEEGLEGGALIVPEDVTNSLLVRATPGDWSLIQQAVQSLDLRPLQVVIEVVIAEVSRSEGLDLGVSFQSIEETDEGFTVIDLPPSPVTPEDAFTIQLGRLGEVVDVQAALAALASTGEVRIVSRPIMLAQNNQPARILVGSQQPFVQFSQAIPTDPDAGAFQTVQYREVGTVLNVLPTVNEDGYVNLALAQEVSSATAETQFGAPVISTREAETQLLARNGQTVVIGGLVDTQVDNVRTGIPFLKDIPLLGLLFGSTRERMGTSELFFFLTPYIVATDADADLFRERVESQRELLAPYLPEEPLTPPVTLPLPLPLPPAVQPGPDTLAPDTTAVPPPPDTLSAGP